MDCLDYVDPAGIRWREIVYWSYNALEALEWEYKKRGCKTWIEQWDTCAPKWALTIKLGEAKKVA